MIRVLIKSLLCGFLFGFFMFGLATLGLGILFFEIYRPIFAPGLYVARLLIPDGSIISIPLVIYLNGLLFSPLLFMFFLSRFNKKKHEKNMGS